MRNVDAEFGLLGERGRTRSSSAERNPGSDSSRRALRRVRFGVRLPDPSGEPGSGAPEPRLASWFEFLTLRRIRYGVEWSSRRWKVDRVLRCFQFVLLRFALRVSSNACSILLPHFDLIPILNSSSSYLATKLICLLLLRDGIGGPASFQIQVSKIVAVPFNCLFMLTSPTNTF